MKNHLGVCALAVMAAALAVAVSPRALAADKISSSCMFNGKKLYGKFQVVAAFPDIKVQVVDSFPDLNVQKVPSFPDSCGKWQRVDAFPDFKVQYVASSPDMKIKYVKSFPGVAEGPKQSPSPTKPKTDFCSTLPKGDTEEDRHKLGAIFVQYDKSGKKPPECFIKRLRYSMNLARPDLFGGDNQSSEKNDSDICSFIPEGDTRDDLRKLLATHDLYKGKGHPVPRCITQRMEVVIKRIKMREGL